MTYDEMVEVLQAAQRGEGIQQRAKGSKTWVGLDPGWDFFRFEYRVKPKPRTWLVWVNPEGHIVCSTTSASQGLEGWVQVAVTEQM